MKGWLTFFTYNNAVPLAVMFVMLGAASTYAATNPESILGAEERVISIDNTYIANIDLGNYSPAVEILAVREDEEFYYVTYEFTTIALQDYVWQDVSTEEELRVPKRALGEYRDLGTYVTEELNELIKAEIARLKETQVFERQQVSQKQVATAYSGLVGGFLNDKVDTVPGYEPKRREPEVEEQTFARPDPAAVSAMERREQIEEPAEVVPPEEPAEPVDPVATTTPDVDGEDDSPATTTDPVDDTNSTSTDDGGDDGSDDGQGSGGGDTQTPTNTKPKLTVLGDNPARVEVGGTYTDLGATVTDDRDTDLTVDVYLNGSLVNKVTIDTSVTGTYTVMYEATDLDGAVAQKTRTVEVYVAETPDDDTDAGDTDPGGEVNGTSTDAVTDDEPPSDPAPEETESETEDPVETPEEEGSESEEEADTPEPAEEPVAETSTESTEEETPAS